MEKVESVSTPMGIILDAFFDETSSIYQLKFSIPAADTVHQCWSPAPAIDRACDEKLLDRIDAFFKSGRFHGLFLFSSDDDEMMELGEAIDEAMWNCVDEFDETGNVEFSSHREVLGSWEYKRADRDVELNWQVPEWVERGDNKSIESYEDLMNVCSDWYVTDASDLC